MAFLGHGKTIYYKCFSYLKWKEGVKVSTVSVRLSDEEKKRLEEYAKENDLTLSQVIRKALKNFLE